MLVPEVAGAEHAHGGGGAPRKAHDDPCRVWTFPRASTIMSLASVKPPSSSSSSSHAHVSHSSAAGHAQWSEPGQHEARVASLSPIAHAGERVGAEVVGAHEGYFVGEGGLLEPPP